MEEKEKYQKILASWETPFTKTSEQAWNDLEPKLSHETTVIKGVFGGVYRKVAFAAAASVALLLAVVFFLGNDSMREVTAFQQETITLPDNSTMRLNADSKAKFAQNWNNERVVELEGQAFFDVQKGKKFVVKTPQGEVQVLGTSFDVFSREKSFRILCYTGKVKVSSQGKSHEIVPGEMVELAQNNLKKSTFDVQRPDWRSGEFFFNNEPLKLVLDEIGRQFNVKINVSDIENRTFTGRFSNKNLQEALETVCLPMGLKYSIEGGVVFIKAL